MKVNYSFDDCGYFWFDIVEDNEHWDFHNSTTDRDDHILDLEKVCLGDDYRSVVEDLNLTIIELFEWID